MTGLSSANPYISSSGIVTVYLLLIVFAVLAFLVVVLSVGHKVMSSVQTKWKGRKKKDKKQEALPEAAPAPALPQEDEDAVVAAIIAAVTVLLEAEAPKKKAKFVVRKIERI